MQVIKAPINVHTHTYKGIHFLMFKSYKKTTMSLRDFADLSRMADQFVKGRKMD